MDRRIGGSFSPLGRVLGGSGRFQNDYTALGFVARRFDCDSLVVTRQLSKLNQRHRNQSWPKIENLVGLKGTLSRYEAIAFSRKRRHMREAPSMTAFAIGRTGRKVRAMIRWHD